jgi:DNA-binding NtrC family response regulator
MSAVAAVQEWADRWHDEDVRPRILVVDDYEGMRVLLSVMLHRLGYEPIAVADAEDGRRVLSEVSVVGVVSDLELPGMDGLELLQLLRAWGDPVPFVLMSAELSAATARSALGAGATLALNKPELIESLPRVLERAGLLIRPRISSGFSAAG